MKRPDVNKNATHPINTNNRFVSFAVCARPAEPFPLEYADWLYEPFFGSCVLRFFESEPMGGKQRPAPQAICASCWYVCNCAVHGRTVVERLAATASRTACRFGMGCWWCVAQIHPSSSSACYHHYHHFSFFFLLYTGSGLFTTISVAQSVIGNVAVLR